MSAAANRLKHLEAQLNIGVCPRCVALPELDVRVLNQAESLAWRRNESEVAGPATCPECGKPEPGRRLIVMTTRVDGPQ
jgi:hypothetical protein